MRRKERYLADMVEVDFREHHSEVEWPDIVGFRNIAVLEYFEAYFRRVLDIARGQQARWLELQAAVSLARLVSDRTHSADHS